MDDIMAFMVLCALVFTPLFIIFAVKNSALNKSIQKYKHELDRLFKTGKISQEEYRNCIWYINNPNTTNTYNRPPVNPYMYPQYPQQPPMYPNQQQGYRPPVNPQQMRQPMPQPFQQNIPPISNPNVPPVMQPQYQQAPPRPVQPIPPQQAFAPPPYRPIPPQQAFAPPPYRPMQPQKPVSSVSNESIKTSIILILGVVFVVLAGIIFSTTTWESLSDIAKTIIIFSVSALFFCVSTLAEKVMHLNKTSTAFYILGSIFLPLTIICAGYFDLLGDWLSLTGEGRPILLMTAFATLGITSYIGSIKHNIAFFSWTFLTCITATFLCLLNQFNMPGDIFSICIAVYSTVFILVIDFSEITEGNSPYSKILKLFSIINTGVLGLISLFITTDGIVSLIPLAIFAFVFLTPLFIHSEHGFGAYPYAVLMFVGLYKLIRPDSISEFLLPFVGLALISTVLSITIVIKDPIKIILKYVSLITVPFVFLFSTSIMVFSAKWNISTLILIAILIFDMSWHAFRDKIRLALYGQTVLLFILLEGLSSYFSPHSPGKLVLFTSLTFVALVAYRSIPKIRTLASDLIFGLTGLVCWYISVNQSADANIATASLICIIIFAIAQLILATDKNKVISIIFSCVVSVVPILIAVSAYQRACIDINETTSFSLCFFPCALILGALAVLSSLFKKDSITLKNISLPSFISSLSLISILFIRELTVDTHRMPYMWIAVIIIAFKTFEFKKNLNNTACVISTVSLLATTVFAMIVSILNYDISDINAWVIVSLLPLIIFAVYLIAKKYMGRNYLALPIFCSYSLAILSFVILLFNYNDENAIGYYLFIIAMSAVSYYAFSFVRINVTRFLPLLYLPFAIKQTCICFTDSDSVIMSVLFLCFFAFLVLGRLIHKSFLLQQNVTESIDWLTITSFIFVFFLPYDEHFVFFVFVLSAFYIMGYFKRGFKAQTDKLLILFTSISLSLAFWAQDFFEIPDIIKSEVFLIPIAILCAVIILLWKDKSEITWNIAFITALLSVIYLGLAAMVSEELTDALIILCLMMIILLISFTNKSMRWFLLSACTLIFLTFYLTRDFWIEIQWWVYLLTAGIILLCMAAAHERRKQKGITKWKFKLFDYFKK